jgi:FAD-dependent urate hydroxylase
LRTSTTSPFGATPSIDLSGASISGMNYGVRRLVAGLARDLYLGDTPRHLESLLACDTPELANTEPEDAPTPDAMPAPAACTS